MRSCGWLVRSERILFARLVRIAVTLMVLGNVVARGLHSLKRPTTLRGRQLRTSVDRDLAGGLGISLCRMRNAEDIAF